ncbi:MAG: hypothetical protein PWQ91_1447 [Eubacteriales bacterium]|nr:hypothetical protein [Eubacteriales bacterium]
MERKNIFPSNLELDEKDQKLAVLEKRVRMLEERIEHLRFSRRVLMNLVEKLEREWVRNLSRLEKENRRLQFSNKRYARMLMEKNRQLVEMKVRMEKSGYE